MQRVEALRGVARTRIRRRSCLTLRDGGRSALLHHLYFRRQTDCIEFARTFRIGLGKEGRHFSKGSLFFALSTLFLSQGFIPKARCEDGSARQNDTGKSLKSELIAPSTDQKSTPKIDEDCPFCRFFLDGPCRDAFIQWHACVQTSEKATDCMDPFRPLKKCMDENEMSFGGDGGDDGSS